jgi:hypothetical protein
MASHMRLISTSTPFSNASIYATGHFRIARDCVNKIQRSGSAGVGSAALGEMRQYMGLETACRVDGGDLEDIW